MDVNGEIIETRPRCTKGNKKLPHLLSTAGKEGADVNFDTLDHGEMSLREREHPLTEVVESQGILPVEDRKGFLIDDSTDLENTGGYVIFFAAGPPSCIAKKAIGFEKIDLGKSEVVHRLSHVVPAAVGIQICCRRPHKW